MAGVIIAYALWKKDNVQLYTPMFIVFCAELFLRFLVYLGRAVLVKSDSLTYSETLHVERSISLLPYFLGCFVLDKNVWIIITFILSQERVDFPANIMF